MRREREFTMSDLVLNNMLQTTASSGSAQLSQRTARDTGSESTDDSFSRALERRMGATDRPPAQPAPGRKTETANAQSANAQTAADKPLQRETGEESPRASESRPESTTKTPAKMATNETAAQQPAVTEAQASPPEASVTHSATPTVAAGELNGIANEADGSTAVMVAAESVVTTAAVVATTDQTVDPALAASLAALMPGIAALPPAVAETGGEGAQQSDTLFDPAASQKSGVSVLEKLIAEASGQSSPATKPGQPAAGFDDHLGALASREWKTDDAARTGDGGPGTLSARLQQPVQSSPGLTTAFAAAPASALQPLQPDAQTAGLQAAAFNPGARTEQSQIPQLPVHSPAGQRVWAEDVGNRMMWMVGRHESKAELVLSPAHLGKLEVSIQMNGDQTTAHFVAATSAARDALEQAMPRLREILQQAGINLGQTNVSTSGDQRSQQDGASGNARNGRGSRAEIASTDGLLATVAATGWTHMGRGIVDTFA
jgi:flagellar hook-length control protein FliK